MNVSRRDLTSLVDSLHVFLKIFDNASKCLQIPLSMPKVETGSTESEGNFFAL